MCLLKLIVKRLKMVRCSILGCKSDSEADIVKLSYHSFPSEPLLLVQKWVAATGRANWFPKKGSKICSLHFHSRHIIKKKVKTLLHPDAIPNEMPNDMENYMNYHLMGSVSQIRMRPGCVPTKYECQERGTANATERPNILKKRKNTLIEECEKYMEERVPAYPSGRTVDVDPTNQKDVSNMITASDEALDNTSLSSETLSIPEMELKEEIATDEDEDLNQSEHENGTTLIPEDEIKEEITIDEHDNFTPCMQLLVKTEQDPLENKEQCSDVIVHDHNYGAAISTQPVTKSMLPSAQESPQPIMLISRVASSEPFSSTPQTSFENFSLNNKINKNMAMELQREKALNAKHKKTIDKLRQKVKMLNSRMRRRDLLVEKLQTEIKNMKS